MCRNSGMFVSPGQSFFYTRGEIFVAFTLGALYLLFQDPTLWGRIKEKRFLYSPPPPPAFPSFLNNSQHMFPEYDLHMYLLILPKEVCDFFSTLIYSLTLMCYNSPAPVAFSNSVCIFILFFKTTFLPSVLGTDPFSRRLCFILYCCKACDLPIHLHNKGLLPQSTINFCTRLKTLRSCVGWAKFKTGSGLTGSPEWSHGYRLSS